MSMAAVVADHAQHLPETHANARNRSATLICIFLIDGRRSYCSSSHITAQQQQPGRYMTPKWKKSGPGRVCLRVEQRFLGKGVGESQQQQPGRYMTPKWKKSGPGRIGIGIGIWVNGCAIV